MALEREFEFYIERQQELVSHYRGKYVVIRGREVIGVYDDEIDAIETCFSFQCPSSEDIDFTRASNA